MCCVWFSACIDDILVFVIHFCWNIHHHPGVNQDRCWTSMAFTRKMIYKWWPRFPLSEALGRYWSVPENHVLRTCRRIPSMYMYMYMYMYIYIYIYIYISISIYIYIYKYNYNKASGWFCINQQLWKHILRLSFPIIPLCSYWVVAVIPLLLLRL